MSSRGSMRELSWPSWEVTIVPGLAQKTRGELRLGKFSWGPALGSWFWEVQLRAAGPSLLQHAFDFRVTPRMDEIDILASSLTLANQREQEARLFTKFQMMPASLVENRSFCDVCTLCCALSQKPFFFYRGISALLLCVLWRLMTDLPAVNPIVIQVAWLKWQPCRCYWVKVVTYAAVIFLCRKRCAVGKSMIYMHVILAGWINCLWHWFF